MHLEWVFLGLELQLTQVAAEHHPPQPNPSCFPRSPNPHVQAPYYIPGGEQDAQSGSPRSPRSPREGGDSSPGFMSGLGRAITKMARKSLLMHEVVVDPDRMDYRQHEDKCKWPLPPYTWAGGWPVGMVQHTQHTWSGKALRHAGARGAAAEVNGPLLVC